MQSSSLDGVIAPAVEALGYEYVGQELAGSDDGTILRVYIDSPDGVNLDDCAKATRQVSAALDVADPISSQYSLEVSSPGLKRPLFKLAHYEQFIGQMVKLKLSVAIEDQRNFKGVIRSVVDNVVTVDVDGQEVELSYSNIIKGKLIPE